MYRLIYQTDKNVKPILYDSEILEHLQEVRQDVVEYITGQGRDFEVSPFIRYIGKDEWVMKRDGTIHWIEEK